MKKIGFTGTSRGMTPQQQLTFRDIIKKRDFELHHGDCIGSDAEAHDIMEEEYQFTPVIHPPLNNKFRAFKKGVMREQKEYLKRNKDIVQETDEMIATPGSFEEELRSGTWMTIRHARKLGRQITIIWPNGKFTVENQR